MGLGLPIGMWPDRSALHPECVGLVSCAGVWRFRNRNTEPVLCVGLPAFYRQASTNLRTWRSAAGAQRRHSPPIDPCQSAY